MELKFSGRRIKVLAGDAESPDGSTSYREIVIHPGAVVLLPISGEKILLIKQYRHAVKEWIIELPAGTLEEGETPEEAAERELLEETGYRAKKLRRLISFYSSPGISNEILHVFLAEDLDEDSPRREKGEIIENFWATMNEALSLIEKNKIKDAKTIASILYYYQFLS
ncbi:MAG: NUDIX hydrolase [Fervidicoccaceae archaeon]